MWSAALFDPAFPARSLLARNSVGWSHHTPDRAIAEGPLEHRGCLLLLAVGDHDGRVDVEHHRVGQIGAGDLRRGSPSGN